MAQLQIVLKPYGVSDDGDERQQQQQQWQQI